MNQTTTHETEKQGWMMRLVTAVCEKCLAWICRSEIHMSPVDAHMFLYYSGFSSSIGLEETMMAESLVRMKWDEGV